jgi:hypothetical protein
VGPKTALEKELEKESLLNKKEIIVLEESENLVKNVMLAFSHSAGIAPDFSDAAPSLVERPIFAIGGDSPLLIPEEVEQFLSKCDIMNYDYFVGMTPFEVLKHFATKGIKRGISLAYTHFAEGVLRINNMHLIKPLKVKNREEFNEIYRIRHLKNIKNFFRLAMALYKRNMTVQDYIGWIKMYMAMWLWKLRFYSASNYLRQEITYGRVETSVSHLLGVRSKIITTCFGGAALDVDRPRNVKVIDRRFNEWITLQRRLGNEYGKI